MFEFWICQIRLRPKWGWYQPYFSVKLLWFCYFHVIFIPQNIVSLPECDCYSQLLCLRSLLHNSLLASYQQHNLHWILSFQAILKKGPIRHKLRPIQKITDSQNNFRLSRQLQIVADCQDNCRQITRHTRFRRPKYHTLSWQESECWGK